MASSIDLLSTSPSKERGVEVSLAKEYLPAMLVEAEIFIRQLKRMFHVYVNKGLVEFKAESHCGEYISVVIYYGGSEECFAAAYDVDNNLPLEWDNEAKNELNMCCKNAL